jgi:hypothetical protein
MAREVVITGEIEGKLTEDLKKLYNRALARALLSQYGRETCEKILEGLKKDEN